MPRQAAASKKRTPDPAVAYVSPRRHGEASAKVYAHLRQQILSGELAPGAHLSQQAIAGLMQTSNGPVISALRRLSYEGLVSYERGHGCRVCDWGDDKLEDLLTVRRALEVEAARLAARRAGPENLERLRHIVEHMGALVREGNREAADGADVEIHVAIAQLSRSPGLIEALGRCHLIEMVRRRLAANERFGDFENLEVNHRKLIEAIASGDPDRAGEVMHTHLSPKRPPRPIAETNGKVVD